MDWLGQLFGLIGGSQTNIEQSRALADSDRKRIGGVQGAEKSDLYIFGGLIVLLIAVIFIYRKK